MKKISKRILAGALAGTMFASFAGCTGNSKDEVPSNLSSYQQSFVDEYGYNNYTYNELSEYMVVKYKTIDSNNEKISVLHPFYDSVSDNIYVYDLEKENLGEFELSDDERVQYNEGNTKEITDSKIKIVANTLGNDVSVENLTKYLVETYGVKTSYSSLELYDVLDKLSYFKSYPLYVDEATTKTNDKVMIKK